MPETPADVVSTLLAHNAWATRRIIERCRDLKPAHFSMTLGIGPGSLKLTLAHIIETMFFFADCFAARPYLERDGFEERSQTPDDLLGLLEEADAELRAAVEAFRSARGEAAAVFWPGAAVPVLFSVAIAQVAEHGSHHRAQCLNMLRRHNALSGLEVHPLRFAGADPE